VPYRMIFSTVTLALIALLVAFPVTGVGAGQGRADTTDLAAEQGILEAYGRLPLLFIENQGQVAEAVSYYVKASGQTLYLMGKGIVFDLIRYERTEAAEMAGRQGERLVYSLNFVGASSQPIIEGVDKEGAVVNYFIGNDPDRWRSGIATYRELIYRDIYPNIDLRLYGSSGTLRYDFIVRPGAGPESIALAYDGIEGLAIEDGGLVVSTAFGDMVQSRPYIYQQIGSEVVEVDGGFRLGSDNSYGFHVGAYNTDYPLVIDPVLVYSTYLGGSLYDYGFGIAVDSAGCAYVTGYTDSFDDFPITEGVAQPIFGGDGDAFVTKLNAEGTEVVYSTYLGGSTWDWGIGIAVDSEGCAYVTGVTYSDDFPTASAYQSIFGGGDFDAFVAKLSADGTDLVYSTYLGGNWWDSGRGIAVDSEGCAYVTGQTLSDNFPTKSPYQDHKKGGLGFADAFVAKIDTTKSGDDSLVYSTYLGGTGAEGAWGIALDSEGFAYVTGETESEDFPTTDGAYQETYKAGWDAFVTKIDTTKSGNDGLVYSTYLGGTDSDVGYGIAVDSEGCAYVTGVTRSEDFPTTAGAYREHNAGGADAFVAKIDTTKFEDASLVYSTYVGGSGSDWGYGIAVDSAGCAYVTGSTHSDDFPTKNSIQGKHGGADSDAFVTKIDTTKSGNDGLVYSTYLGGTDSDVGYGIAVDSEGCAYVTGYTGSGDFPTRSPYQPDYAGNYDAFVTRLCVEAEDEPQPPAPHRGGAVYPVWTVLLAGLVAGALLMQRRRHRGQESA